MDIGKNKKSVNTGLYIGKGCFYYLLINNLLVGCCYQVCTKKTELIVPWLVKELEINKKLNLNHLQFILQGALVDGGPLWPTYYNQTFCMFTHKWQP